jgi:hypothetical protein
VASRPGIRHQRSALPRDFGHVAAQIEAGIPECFEVDPPCLERIVACNRLAIRPFAKNCDQDEMPLQIPQAVAFKRIYGAEHTKSSGADARLFPQLSQCCVLQPLALLDLPAWKAPETGIGRVRTADKKNLSITNDDGKDRCNRMI